MDKEYTVEELLKDIAAFNEHIARMDALLGKAISYTKHHSSCGAAFFHKECTCGLHSVLDGIQKELNG